MLTFENLRVYKLAVKLRDELHEELKKNPNHWQTDDARQAWRSSSSVPSNIAEGYSRRFYLKDFLHFINIALGSSDETQNHILALKRNGQMAMERADYFLNQYKTLSIQTLNFLNAWQLKLPKPKPISIK